MLLWTPNSLELLPDLLVSFEYTVWKFEEFSANQILREINFGHLEAPRTAILTIF